MDETTKYQDLKSSKDFIDLTGFRVPHIGGNLSVECDEDGNFYFDKSEFDIKEETDHSVRFRIKGEPSGDDYQPPAYSEGGWISRDFKLL